MNEAFLTRWLKSVPALTTLVSDRIAVRVYPEDGFPAIQIGSISTRPLSNAGAQVDRIFDGQAVIYVHGGRLNGGKSDLPDLGAAFAVAEEIVNAARGIQKAQWHDTESGLSLVLARVITNTAVRDPDTGGARQTITLDLRTF